MTPLPPFIATIDWLRAALTAIGRNDLAGQINDNWCWFQIGNWYHGLSDADRYALEPLVAALIASGDGEALCWYTCYVADRDDVRAALIAVGDGQALGAYLRFVSEHPAPRRARRIRGVRGGHEEGRMTPRESLTVLSEAVCLIVAVGLFVLLAWGIIIIFG